MRHAVNLTDQQKDLLRLLVAMHESLGGRPFILVRSPAGYGLVYVGGFSISIKNDEFDFRDLRRERCISFVPIGTNQWNGKPTRDGISMIIRGFHGRRLMRDFETRCPLLSAAARERLQQAGDAREAELSYRIEMAATIIRTRREEVTQVQEESTKKTAESILLRQTRILRQRVLPAAETVAIEGVRGFAAGLVASQGRLAVHTVLLRNYTAGLASALRHWLNSSEVFRRDPLLPWQRDSLTQKAIQTCEDALAERTRVESAGSHDPADIGGASPGEPKTWLPLVQEWEALKSERRTPPDEPECIPESDLSILVARQYGITAEQVTDAHIELAAVDLCRHYELFRIIPVGGNCLTPENQKVDPIQDAVFWREREGDFRERDTEEDKVLGATWFSSGEYWTFHKGAGGSPAAKLVDTFKSRAREAAKGLGSRRLADSWREWLDLLRRTTDEDTGKFIYAKNCPGSCVISEREQLRMLAAGEVIPAGGVTEFIATEDGGIERRTYWDTRTAVIENLFENSAHLCRRLRSLAPRTVEDAGAPALEVGDAGRSTAEALGQAPGGQHKPLAGRTDERPLGEDPFPSDFLAHDLFEEATWKAKAKIAAFRLEFQRGTWTTGREFLELLLRYRKQWFTTCAHEATLVVGNEGTAGWYEQWIDDQADFIYANTVSVLSKKDPSASATTEPFFSQEDIDHAERHLKLELMKMATYYKGVAASRVTELLGLRHANPAKLTVEEESLPGSGPPVAQDELAAEERAGASRRAQVDAYIEEVCKATGKRITRTDIWRFARYKTRTEFERWERNDPNRPNQAADERFTKILKEKPHLK